MISSLEQPANFKFEPSSVALHHSLAVSIVYDTGNDLGAERLVVRVKAFYQGELHNINFLALPLKESHDARIN